MVDIADDKRNVTEPYLNPFGYDLFVVGDSAWRAAVLKET